MPCPNNLYEQDYYLWIEDVLKKIQEKRWNEMDWDNLWEEIDDMGKSQKQRLTSKLLWLFKLKLRNINPFG